MAEVFPVRTSAYKASPQARLNAARTRLATALAASTFLHLWFAGGAAVETLRPQHTPTKRLTVRLEPAAAPQILGPRAEKEPTFSDTPRQDFAVRQNERHREGVLPAPEQGLRGTSREEPLAAPVRPPPLASPVDATYYPAHELDVYPMPLARLGFEHPERAARDHVSGQVRLMLLIDEAGNVDDVSVVTAEPSGYFEDAARQAFEGVRFSPARKEGRAVKSRVLINVDFTPRSIAGVLH
jgi:protein TonB